MMNYVAARIDNNTFTLIARKGAWLTIDRDGSEQKIRNSDAIELLTQEDIDIEEEFGDQTEFTLDDFEVEQELEDDLEEETAESMASHIRKYRSRYTKHPKREGVTESGRSVVDNNDKVADLCRGVWLDDLYKKAESVLNISVHDLKAKYRHLNNGQQSMCLRNRIRGFYKRQEA